MSRLLWYSGKQSMRNQVSLLWHSKKRRQEKKTLRAFKDMNRMLATGLLPIAISSLHATNITWRKNCYLSLTLFLQNTEDHHIDCEAVFSTQWSLNGGIWKCSFLPLKPFLREKLNLAMIPQNKTKNLSYLFSRSEKQHWDYFYDRVNWLQQCHANRQWEMSMFCC